MRISLLITHLLFAAKAAELVEFMQNIDKISTEFITPSKDVCVNAYSMVTIDYSYGNREPA
jgi:hypothetical protein